MTDEEYFGEYDAFEPDDELLPCGCAICDGPLYEYQAVRTAKGFAHEDCAEQAYPFNPERDLGIPPAGM